MRVAVIGGGVGGLTAATRLAILGHKVQIFEARDDVGGLASGFQREGVWFDGGPYILLDRPGLEWALERIGLDVGPLNLKACEDLYEVTRPSSGASRHLLPREKAATNSEPSPAGRGWREAP
ncbi:MAG TPA: NAD(P)-binding protein, partial [Thermoanaerobaculia bacterium]|nr:NAD(P)-binding protein [Thermoanaerobaculia bacterium]